MPVPRKRSTAGARMRLAEGIRKHGFRKWYERELMQSHAHLALTFICMVGVFAAFEAAHAPSVPGATSSPTWVAVCCASAPACGRCGATCSCWRTPKPRRTRPTARSARPMAGWNWCSPTPAATKCGCAAASAATTGPSAADPLRRQPRADERQRTVDQQQFHPRGPPQRPSDQQADHHRQQAEHQRTGQRHIPVAAAAGGS